MYVHPCRHCPKFKKCELYQATLKALRKSPVKATVMRIVCNDFLNVIPPGTRIKATVGLYYNIEDTEECGRYDLSTESGTVMGPSWKKDKLRIHIDALEGEPDAIRHRYPSQLIVLDEPRIELCPGCKLPINIISRPRYISHSWYCSCDVPPSKRKDSIEYGIVTEADIELPYPCQTVAMIVEDL